MPPRPLDRPLPQGRPPGFYRLVLQKAPQVLGQLLRGSVTLLRALGHRLEHDRLEFRRNSRVQPPERLWLIEGDLPQHFLAITAGVGPLQRQQLIKRHTQRIDVGARVDDDALGQGLFRAHVADGAQQIPRHGQSGVGPQSGQAEVGDPQPAAGVNQQVGRFDVPVDHPQLVRVLQGLGRLHAQLGRGTEESRALRRISRGQPRDRGAGGLAGWGFGARVGHTMVSRGRLVLAILFGRCPATRHQVAGQGTRLGQRARAVGRLHAGEVS